MKVGLGNVRIRWALWARPVGPRGRWLPGVVRFMYHSVNGKSTDSSCIIQIKYVATKFHWKSFAVFMRLSAPVVHMIHDSKNLGQSVAKNSTVQNAKMLHSVY